MHFARPDALKGTLGDTLRAYVDNSFVFYMFVINFSEKTKKQTQCTTNCLFRCATCVGKDCRENESNGRSNESVERQEEPGGVGEELWRGGESVNVFVCLSDSRV